MRIFKYIGDQKSVSPFGMTFPKDTGVKVDDDRICGKLENNSHFQEVAGVNDEAAKKAAAEKRKEALAAKKAAAAQAEESGGGAE